MPPRRPNEERVRIPTVSVDPLASLEISGLWVTLGGQDIEIPALDAVSYLRLLLAPELAWEGIFPGLCTLEDEAKVHTMMLEGAVSEKELADTILDVIETVSGRPWYVTIRLCMALRERWDLVGGTLAANGIKPCGVSLSWWLDAAYFTLLDRMIQSDAKKAAEFVTIINQIPRGFAPETTAAQDSDAFLAAMRMAR